MTARDENDLTDEELLEMWEQGEPVEVAPPDEAPPGSGRENSRTTPTSRRKPAERRDA